MLAALIGGSTFMPALTLRPTPPAIMPAFTLLPTPLAYRRCRAMSLCSQSAAGEHRDLLRLTPFWRNRLSELTKPAAVSLVPRLSTANALCFENMAKASRTSGTLVEFAALEKEKRPDQLLLCDEPTRPQRPPPWSSCTELPP